MVLSLRRRKTICLNHSDRASFCLIWPEQLKTGIVDAHIPPLVGLGSGSVFHFRFFQPARNKAHTFNDSEADYGKDSHTSHSITTRSSANRCVDSAGCFAFKSPYARGVCRSWAVWSQELYSFVDAGRPKSHRHVRFETSGSC